MAEGIKISEMEQVTTLEDGCCFPVVSNGNNNKITKKRLWETLITGNSKGYDENFNDGSTVVGYDGTDKKLCIRTIDKVWIYIQNKISSVLGLTKSTYNGTAKTISETLPIEKGGTGANDVKTAHKNIVVDYISEYNSNFEDASSILSMGPEKIVTRQAVNFWNYIQRKISPTINDLQNQINSIKKPDGIEVFRIGINESTSGWNLYTTTENGITYYWKTKSFKVNGTVINTCITQGYARENVIRNNANPNGYKYDSNEIIIDINLGNSNQNVICKGYIEYV